MHYKKLEARFAKINDLNHALSMLSWDDAAVMPTGGGVARAEALATLNGLIHTELSAPEIPDLIDAAADEPLDAWQSANVLEMKRSCEDAMAVPADLVMAYSKATSLCEQRWRQLRAANDFKGILPLLSEVVNLTKRRAQCLSEAKGLGQYDALLDTFEPGLRQVDIDPLFSSLLDFLPACIDSILSQQEPAIPIEGPFAEDRQANLGRLMMAQLGFDFDHGRLDVSHHPFCGGVPDDTRITTRYNENNFLESLFGVLHETGHALYEQGLPASWRTQPVGGSGGMALHESQSLFMEMQVCRSPAFIAFAAPHIRNAFGGGNESAEWSADNLLRHVRKVGRGFIRVDADEATYPMHVILRYDLEKALVAGDLDPAEIPDAWDEKMRSYLGLGTVGNDADGCMQDVHWFSGTIGYFPTYTLGALAAAQLFKSATQAIDDLPGLISHGEFEGLVGWLRQNVHSQGRMLATGPLIEKVTGEPLSAEPFKAHLVARYLD
ncbi:MAG: carboxypeptidase M32 [Pseudomonadales bacterium]|nr:carboxypeptidase M32 [Pseudomonadales bacterium]